MAPEQAKSNYFEVYIVALNIILVLPLSQAARTSSRLEGMGNTIHKHYSYLGLSTHATTKAFENAISKSMFINLVLNHVPRTTHHAPSTTHTTTRTTHHAPRTTHHDGHTTHHAAHTHTNTHTHTHSFIHSFVATIRLWWMWTWSKAQPRRPVGS